MFHNHQSEDDSEMFRYTCPHCGKEFEAAGNKWDSGDLICPFCGGEFER